MSRMTVIIPCYNLAGVIATTLASLRRATDDRVELLFLDDASTDATGDLLAAGVRGLRGARLHRSEHNLGLAGVRNLGLELAETEYLTFFDGDDVVSAGYFGALLEEIARLGVDFVRTDHVRITGRERVLHRVPDGHRQGRIGRPREAILPVGQRTSVDYPYAWAGAYHRSLAEAGLLRFPDLRTAEDRPWIWNLHLGAESFSVPALAGIGYRRDVAGSLSRVASSTQLDFVRAMQQVVERVQDDPEAERFLPKAVRRWCELTLHHLGHMDRFPPEIATTFRQLLGQGLAGAPTHALTTTLASLTPERRDRLTRLMAPYRTGASSPATVTPPREETSR